ncbi:hypothetical protein SEA_LITNINMCQUEEN_75 [Gordonia phage LitninMcQueen]
MIVFEAPERYRGTIEVWEVVTDTDVEYGRQWYWHCKSNNHAILAQGEGYRRRSGALNAIDAQYSARLQDGLLEDVMQLVVPWRLVVRDRHGDITTTGAVY